MTLEELLAVAEIVEKLTNRYRDQEAAHKAALTEIRASFNARTIADGKRYEGILDTYHRSALDTIDAALKREESTASVAKRLVEERDALLTQVQNMRAEIKQRAKEQDQDHKTIVSLMSERDGLRVQVQDMREEIIRVNDAHGQTLVECDALRAKVDLLTTLRPKYKVGDKLESYSSAVTIVGVRTVYDCQTDGAEYPVGHSEDELKERYEQTPKQHPVKVGEWVECVCAPGVGTKRQVLEVHADWYLVDVGHSWNFDFCIPCDPPATHDTPEGRSVAESVIRDGRKTEPVAEEVKVGDLGEVFQATTRTLNSDVGITGCVSSIHLDPCHGGFLVKFDPSTQSRRSAGMQAFGLCDVRKVTT